MAQATKEISPEEKAKRVAAKKSRNAAKKVIRQYMVSAECPKDLNAALLAIVGNGSRGRGAGATSIQRGEIRQAVIDGGKNGISEFELFKQFKIGRPEMHVNIRTWLRYVDNPDDRVWVVFDEEKESYGVVGTGADAPKGWTGYVPPVEETL